MELSGKNAIKNLLLLWIVGVGLFLTPVYIGTFFTGKFESDNSLYRAIIWFLIGIIPVFIFLLNIYTKINNEKYINKFYYKLIYWISIFYLSSLLVIVMIRPFFDMTRDIEKSFYATLPLEFLLLFLLYITFFKENRGSQKDNRGMNYMEKKNFIVNLITNGDIDRAFQELINIPIFSEDDKIFNELLVLKTQWESLKQDKNLNLVSYDFIQVHQSRIINSMFNIVNRL